MSQNKIGRKENHREKEELTPLAQEPNNRKLNYDTIENRAERARANGFIQLGYLPEIFSREERYAAILPGLWQFFECDRVPQIRHLISAYERWFWILGLRVRVWAILYLFEHTCKDFQAEILLVS